MADTSPDAPANKGALPGLPDDWPQQATAKVVDLVDTARTKTSGPAIKVSRAIVYGLVAALLGLLALPLFLIGLTRGVIVLVDKMGVDHDKAVWISYAGIGTLMLLIGFLLWSKRPKGAAVPKSATTA